MKYRWQITSGCAFVFALIGLGIGSLIDTKHPDDRMADLMIPTMAFLLAGLLIGYVSSLVLYKRFAWFDAVASLVVPPICFFGFLFAKSGSWLTGQMFACAAAGIVAFLVLRFSMADKRLKDLDILRPVVGRSAKNDE